MPCTSLHKRIDLTCTALCRRRLALTAGSAGAWLQAVTGATRSTVEAHTRPQLVQPTTASTACAHHTSKPPTCTRHSGSNRADPFGGTSAVFCKSPECSVFLGYLVQPDCAAQAGKETLGAAFSTKINSHIEKPLPAHLYAGAQHTTRNAHLALVDAAAQHETSCRHLLLHHDRPVRGNHDGCNTPARRPQGIMAQTGCSSFLAGPRQIDAQGTGPAGAALRLAQWSRAVAWCKSGSIK